jgi:hypothetical protein
MPTYTLQCVVSVLFVSFGVLSLLVARRARGADPHHVAGWLLTGIAFTVHGSLDALQQAWAGWAYFYHGAASPQADDFMRVMPVLQHGRTGWLMVFFALVAVLAVRKAVPGPRFWRAAPLLMLAGFALGGWLGWLEGSFTTGEHLKRVGLSDLGELALVMPALFLLLVRDRADRLLWSALATYAFMLAMNVIWMMAFERIEDPNVWAPPRVLVPAYRTVLVSVMAAFAWRRLRAAREGRQVPPLVGGARRPAIFPG